LGKFGQPSAICTHMNLKFNQTNDSFTYNLLQWGVAVSCLFVMIWWRNQFLWLVWEWFSQLLFKCNHFNLFSWISLWIASSTATYYLDSSDNNCMWLLVHCPVVFPVLMSLLFSYYFLYKMYSFRRNMDLNIITILLRQLIIVICWNRVRVYFPHQSVSTGDFTNVSDTRPGVMNQLLMKIMIFHWSIWYLVRFIRIISHMQE